MTLRNNPVSRSEDVVVQELNGEVLIYDLQINKAFSLNETSTLVWQLCDGNNSVADISRQVETKLVTPFGEAVAWLALNELRKNKLLTNMETIDVQFNGLTRREVIRQIGLTSMIALPVISALVAPKATSAQSPAAACTAPAMGTTGAMFGGCLNINAAACLADCNAPLPFSAVSLVCCTGMATAESCTPVAGSVSCVCTCT